MWNKDETLIAARKIYDRDGVVKIKVEKLETGGFALDMKGAEGTDIETVIYDDMQSAKEDGQTVMRVFRKR